MRKNEAFIKEIRQFVPDYCTHTVRWGRGYRNDNRLTFSNPRPDCLYVMLLLHLKDNPHITRKELYGAMPSSKTKLMKYNRQVFLPNGHSRPGGVEERYTNWSIITAMLAAGLVKRVDYKYYVITDRGKRYIDCMKKYNII